MRRCQVRKQKWKCLVFLILLTSFTGCAMSDFVWSVFGSGYSGGGVSEYDRKYDYDQRVKAANHADGTGY